MSLDTSKMIPITGEAKFNSARMYYDPSTRYFHIFAPGVPTFPLGGATTTLQPTGPTKGAWETQWAKHRADIKAYQQNQEDDGSITLTAPTISTELPYSGTDKPGVLEYPTNAYEGEVTTDWVSFQFGEYVPPFGKDVRDAYNEQKEDEDQIGAFYGLYQLSSNLENEPVEVRNPIGNETQLIKQVTLPYPQDLGTEVKQNWSAKGFTSLGRAAIMTANGDLSAIPEQLRNSDVLTSAHAAIKASVLNKIPGVGGNITINDILGSSIGAVLNPNAEMLYESPDLREISMTYKMIARNAPEAAEIKMICDYFRTASLPRWGAKVGSEDLRTSDVNADELVSGENFIRVPLLCQIRFMSGSSLNKYVPQYKPCALTGVDITYTPDGTYATYANAAPVAVELRLKFAETKLIFQNEVLAGF